MKRLGTAFALYIIGSMFAMVYIDRSSYNQGHVDGYSECAREYKEVLDRQQLLIDFLNTRNEEMDVSMRRITKILDNMEKN